MTERLIKKSGISRNKRNNKNTVRGSNGRQNQKLQFKWDVCIKGTITDDIEKKQLTCYVWMQQAPDKTIPKRTWKLQPLEYHKKRKLKRNCKQAVSEVTGARDLTEKDFQNKIRKGVGNEQLNKNVLNRQKWLKMSSSSIRNGIGIGVFQLPFISSWMCWYTYAL